MDTITKAAQLAVVTYTGTGGQVPAGEAPKKLLTSGPVEGGKFTCLKWRDHPHELRDLIAAIELAKTEAQDHEPTTK